MSPLNIISGKTGGPRRIGLYGLQGIGKTTWATCAPNPIILQTEDGAGDIDCDKFPLASSYSEVMKNLESLYVEQHAYKTVVVDSLDWLERIIWQEVCSKKNVTSIEDIGYAKGYTFALTQWREILEALSALRNERGLTIILVAHSKIEKFENPETESYDRYAMKLHKLAAAVVQEWCDEVLFATYKVYTKTTGEGLNKRAQGIGGDERVLKTREHPAYAAKNRLNLPEELPLVWSEYAQFLKGDK